MIMICTAMSTELELIDRFSLPLTLWFSFANPSSVATSADWEELSKTSWDAHDESDWLVATVWGSEWGKDVLDRATGKRVSELLGCSSFCMFTGGGWRHDK